MKVWDCLPKEISACLRACTDLREIRIRNNRPTRVNVGGQWYTVGEKGLASYGGGAALGVSCDEIVKRACNNSVYAYEKMLAQGFFTLEDGVRIGVCGNMSGAAEAVFRRYSSLCFRIPHCIGVANDEVMNCCGKGNVVVIGPPCSGKTTLLRDIAVKLSAKHSVLVADERGELFYDEKLLAACDCDVLKWASKRYVFEVGVRAMSPQWIVCDEISVEDTASVKEVVNSGVNIACSAHGKNVGEFVAKFGLKDQFVTAIVLGSIGSKRQIESLGGSNYIENRRNTY